MYSFKASSQLLIFRLNLSIIFVLWRTEYKGLFVILLFVFVALIFELPTKSSFIFTAKSYLEQSPELA